MCLSLLVELVFIPIGGFARLIPIITIISLISITLATGTTIMLIIMASLQISSFSGTSDGRCFNKLFSATFEIGKDWFILEVLYTSKFI